MPSLIERIREWLAPDGADDPEHEEIRRRLAAQQLRITALDAYVQVRGSRLDRRRTFAASHPNRRASDG
jgi:hypothetical protein